MTDGKRTKRRYYAMRARLDVLWFGRLRGRCICCGSSAPRRGQGSALCDECFGLPRDVDLRAVHPAVVEEWLT